MSDEILQRGSWVAGLTDGEGCFSLWCCREPAGFNVVPAFQIGLRSDDVQALHIVRQAIGTGTVGPRKVYGESKAQNVYSVAKIPDLVKVVRFFEAYPLRAKKAKDFAIWKQAIALLAEIIERPYQKTSGRGRSKWTEEDRLTIERLAHELIECRKWRTL